MWALFFETSRSHVSLKVILLFQQYFGKTTKCFDDTFQLNDILLFQRLRFLSVGPEFNQEIAPELIEIHRSQNSTEIELRIQVCK